MGQPLQHVISCQNSNEEIDPLQNATNKNVSQCAQKTLNNVIKIFVDLRC